MARQLILKLRPVINYKHINSSTITWPQKIPSPLHSLNKLRGAQVFSKLDLANAYLNISIREEDRHLTTFITPTFKLYQFTRLPFGLKNAGSFFTFFLNTILEELGDNHLVYQDDVVLYSRTEGEHEDLLRRFGDIMAKYNLKLSPKKCIFFRKKVEYVSFLIDRRGVQISEEKVRAVREFAPPATVTQVQ